MGWDSGGFMGSAGESSQGMDANAVGMGALGGAGSPTGANYGAITRHLINAFSKYYGNNSSLLAAGWGLNNRSGVPTDDLPGGYLPGSVSNTPHNSQLTTVDIRDPNRNTPHNSQLGSVDLMDPNLQDPMGGGVGGTPAGGYSFGGMTPGVPTDANPGGVGGGGGERPWWLEGTNNGMNPYTGMTNPNPYTGMTEPAGIINYAAGHRPRPRRAYDNVFMGGDDM